MIKKYLLYLVRWQLSTPILAIVLILLADLNNPLIATIIANLIGGLIFFWVDRFIFRSITKNPLWEIADNVECSDCGKTERGYRIVEWFKYNRRKDKKPEYRCESCKDIKQALIKEKIKKV